MLTLRQGGPSRPLVTRRTRSFSKVESPLLRLHKCVGRRSRNYEDETECVYLDHDHQSLSGTPFETSTISNPQSDRTFSYLRLHRVRPGTVIDTWHEEDPDNMGVGILLF